jgi:hypothetical protein
MLIEPEDGRSGVGHVSTNALENAGPVVDRVRQHMDLGVGKVHELPVHPDLLYFFERHRGLLGIFATRLR